MRRTVFVPTTRRMTDLCRRAVGDAFTCNLGLEFANQPTVNDVGSLTLGGNARIFVYFLGALTFE